MNLSLSSLLINVWKVGKAIALLKPNKPSDEGTSYRPIPLLSCLMLLFVAFTHLRLPSCYYTDIHRTRETTNMVSVKDTALLQHCIRGLHQNYRKDMLCSPFTCPLQLLDGMSSTTSPRWLNTRTTAQCCLQV